MLKFDRGAFIIASTATEEEMRRWYHEHIVWSDKALNMKLMRKGILTRIYAPMAIIQGLRESGAFRSVMETSLLKESLLSSSNKTSNSSGDRIASSESTLSSRKMGTIRVSQATVRKVLQIASNITFASYAVAAIPPLSPPGLDDQLITIREKNYCHCRCSLKNFIFFLT
ncbi:hypothetical protein MKX01_039191 [Papaver californicum]|nr:hypothetical protein MKX01_039191 [Papaver californicum]